MAKKIQPAKKSYFFEKGYVDMGNTIKGAWKSNGDSIKGYVQKMKDLDVDNLPKKIFFSVVYILAIIAVCVFGSVITGVITVINVAVLVVFMTVIYLGFSILWLIDRTYLSIKKISVACTECKEHYLIPVYICPKCGEKHDNLTPSSYGILHHECNCGEKLPCTFMNGRKALKARCPNCDAPISSEETRPICIPVVGGRSVGKTAFITAFSKDFIETVAPAKGFNIRFYDDTKAKIYKEISHDYASGGTRMTRRPQGVNEISSVSFSFFVDHPELTPSRLIHVYDIPGEVFTNNDETEVQKQYEYCNGIVFMIDPFAIPEVYNRFEETLDPNDRSGIGGADINTIVDAFLEKLRQVTGLRDKDMASVPLAVVIGKIDAAGLQMDIGDLAVRKLMATQPDKFTDYYDTQDYLCRQFLLDNGMASFVNGIKLQFKNYRFFACSAIGHTRDKGGKYVPEGVLAPMEWLVGSADSKMDKLWADHTFSKKNKN